MARTVLYVAWAPFFSGAERALLLTLRGLDPARYRPTVAVGSSGELAHQLQSAGIDCRAWTLAQRDWRLPIGWLRSIHGLIRIAKDAGADLIHANEVPSFPNAALAARFLGVPAITHLRFPLDPPAYRWFLTPLPSRAIAISEAFERETLTAVPALGGKTRVIPDGIELPALISPVDRAVRRQHLGLQPSDVAVSLIGQVSEVKGIWDLLEAARLLSNDSLLRYVVVGDDLQTRGALLQRLRERVSAAGLQDRFLFLGFRSDAADLVSLFDIAAVPSHVEPLGLSALEAMAAGVPVVASSVGGLCESVVDGTTGILVPPRDPQALAASLAALAHDPSRRERYGAAGRQRVIERFSVMRHAGALQDVYDELLDERRART